MSLPSSTKYAIIGAGIHGLSTALHLAQRLQGDRQGLGGRHPGRRQDGDRRRRLRHRLRRGPQQLLPAGHARADGAFGRVWESDPKAFSYHPVGYMQISPEVMHEQVGTIYEQQKAIGYKSVFIEGAADSQKYMKGLFDDWQAKGITSVLHEKRGGYANNTASMYGFATKAEAEGVRILTGVKVHRLRVRLELGRRDGAHHQPGQYRLRPCRHRRRPLGQADLGHARSAEDHHGQGPRRQGP